MKRIYLLIPILLLSGINSAQENAWTRYVNTYQSVVAAINEQDYESALDAYGKLLEFYPYDADSHYRIARLYALNGDNDNALISLKKALELGHDFGDNLDSLFIPLKEMDGFDKINKLIVKMQTPVNTSSVAVTITEKDFVPEGMAFDPVEKCFYLGSLWKYKIIKINSDGSFSDFTETKQDGLRKMTGMKVDADRRILWAASMMNSARPDIEERETGWSGIFKYDLNTGNLIRKYTLHEDGKRHLFNDIDIASNGDIYFTDSDNNTVYKIKHDVDEIELFINNEKLLYPNGITFGKDDNTLYVVSSGDGIYKVDIASGGYNQLKQPENICLGGVDGMYYFENSLLCVQNGMNRISRFYLNEAGDGVEKLEILETRNPYFEIPTTGAIVGDEFYYIANSQMNKVNREGKILPVEELNDIILLKTTVKK